MENNDSLSVKQQVGMVFYLICLLFWFMSLLCAVVGAFTGVLFIFNMTYGLEAFILVIVTLAMTLWWLYIPTLAYIIFFTIYAGKHKEFKNFKYGYFVIAVAICIVVAISGLKVYDVLSTASYNNTYQSMDYCTKDVVIIDYTDDFAKLVNIKKSLDYDDLFDLSSAYPWGSNSDLSRMLLKYTGNYTQYSLLTSAVIDGIVTDYSISDLEITNDGRSGRLTVDYTVEEADKQSLILIFVSSFDVETCHFDMTFNKVKELER
jgi:hypothetical protein